MAKAVASPPKFAVPVPVPGLPPIPVHVPGTGGNDGIHIPDPTNAVKDVVHGTEAVGKFFLALLDPHTWIRVGEVLVGTVLLIAGIDHMFGTNLTGKAAKVAPYMMV